MNTSELVTNAFYVGEANAWALRLNDRMRDKDLGVEDVLFAAGLYFEVGGVKIHPTRSAFITDDPVLVSLDQMMVVWFWLDQWMAVVNR